MFRIRPMLGTFLLAFFSPVMAFGDLVLSVDPNTTLGSGGDTLQVDILIRSDPTDSLRDALTVDFLLQSGSFIANDNGFSDGGGATRTGRFGQEGFLGNGNLQPTSFLVFDPAAPNFATMSLDFTSNQNFSASPNLLARLLIDVSGVAPGTYNINIENITSNGGNQEGTGVSVGSFTIVAVPEPNLCVLIGMMVATATVAGRRRRR